MVPRRSQRKYVCDDGDNLYQRFVGDRGETVTSRLFLWRSGPAVKRTKHYVALETSTRYKGEINFTRESTLNIRLNEEE